MAGAKYFHVHVSWIDINWAHMTMNNINDAARSVLLV